MRSESTDSGSVPLNSQMTTRYLNMDFHVVARRIAVSGYTWKVAGEAWLETQHPEEPKAAYQQILSLNLVHHALVVHRTWLQ